MTQFGILEVSFLVILTIYINWVSGKSVNIFFNVLNLFFNHMTHNKHKSLCVKYC